MQYFEDTRIWFFLGGGFYLLRFGKNLHLNFEDFPNDLNFEGIEI